MLKDASYVVPCTHIVKAVSLHSRLGLKKSEGGLSRILVAGIALWRVWALARSSESTIYGNSNAGEQSDRKILHAV